MSEKFSSVLLRLKEQLGIQSDKDIAKLLGMSEKAFNARKARESFPNDKLFALKGLRPDLDIDVSYVLIGARQTGQVRALTDRTAAKVKAGQSPSNAAAMHQGLKIRAEIDAEPDRRRLYEAIDLNRIYCSDSELKAVLAVMSEFAARRQAELATSVALPSQAGAVKVQQNFHAEVGQAIAGGDHMQNTYVASRRKARTP